MSSLFSKMRKRIERGDSKLLITKYTPEIYSVVETPEPKGEHAEFMKPRYMLKDDEGRLIRTELKLNNPNATRSAKLFFGSELIRVGDNVNDNMMNKEFNNHDANLINTGRFDEFVKGQKKKGKTKRIILEDEQDADIINDIPDIDIPNSGRSPTRQNIVGEIPIKRTRTKNKHIFNDDFINEPDVAPPAAATLPATTSPVKRKKDKKIIETQPVRQSGRDRTKNRKYFGDDFEN